jgi:hypothetical protein
LSIQILSELERIKQQKEELQQSGGMVDGNADDRNVRKQQPVSLRAMLTSQASNNNKLNGCGKSGLGLEGY